MDLFRDMKFQLGLVALIVAGVHFFAPEIDESALTEVISAAVGLILGGHSVAALRNKKNS